MKGEIDWQTKRDIRDFLITADHADWADAVSAASEALSAASYDLEAYRRVLRNVLHNG